MLKSVNNQSTLNPITMSTQLLKLFSRKNLHFPFKPQAFIL
jgi:hypothetical protein